MAIIKKGILGPVEGSVGQVVGYIRKGVPIIRKKGDRERLPRSDRQKAVNKRFAFAMSFVKPTKNFINVSFSCSTEGGQTAHNVAVSKTLEAVRGDATDNHFDYSALIVADGELPPALNARVEMAQPGLLRFLWDQDPSHKYQRGQDQVMLLAYMPQQENAFYILSGARRAAGQEVLEVPTGEAGKVLETYIAFISDDRKQVSLSTYTGQVSII